MHRVRNQKRKTRFDFRLENFFQSGIMVLDPPPKNVPQFHRFLLNKLNFSYVNHLKFINQCFLCQCKPGQDQPWLLFFLWVTHLNWQMPLIERHFFTCSVKVCNNFKYIYIQFVYLNKVWNPFMLLKFCIIHHHNWWI